MNGIELIKAERERQISAEGWTAEHDDQHDCEEIAMAAACYATPWDVRPTVAVDLGEATPDLWPWSREAWKPTPYNRVRELVKAGALIAAEIDRLQRNAPQNA